MVSSTFADVQKEYEKNEELKKEDVQSLQKWVAEQQHLPKISELYLILFLHRNYYNIELTKKCVDKFYSMRTYCPEFFKNRNPTVNTKVLKTALYVPLSKRTPEGYQIMFWKFIDFNPAYMVLEEMAKSLDMSAILMLLQTGTVSGHTMLTDSKGMTPQLLARMEAKKVYLKKIFTYLQDALPIRLKNVIFFNVAPTCIDLFSAMMNLCLKEELTNIMQIYGEEYDELYKIIPKECFPSDYGGESESIEELIKIRNENFLAHESFFVEGEEEITDESKRLGKPVSAEDLFGDN